MMTAYLMANTGSISVGGLELLQQWKPGSDEVLWLDILTEGHVDSDIVPILSNLNCHDLAIVDALRKRHSPKFELFEDHVFLLYRGMSDIKSNLEFTHQQIALFVGKNYLISVHPKASLGIDLEVNKGHASLSKHTPMSLALSVIHNSAGIYLEHVLSFENELSDIEETLYTEKSESVLVELAGYKANLIKLKRVFNYHRVMFDELKRKPALDMPFDCTDYEHRINDVAERLERLYSLAQMHYDICGDMIDSYISITSHQMNLTMRVLTVVTVVFVPLTFIAGIYGMNFDNIPELHFKYAYHTVLVLMLLITVTLILLFKRRKWF